MRVIEKEKDLATFQKIFKQLQNGQGLLIWQISDDGKRDVCDSKLESFHLSSRKIRFILQSSNNFSIGSTVYCYSEEQQLIFKTSVEELKETHFIGPYPEEIRLLDESEVGDMRDRIQTFWKTKRISTEKDDLGSDYMRVKSMAQRSSRDQAHLNKEFGESSADAEERFFADKRSSPRAKPKGDKWVKVLRVGEVESELFKLTDLSRGGLGFIVYNEDQFVKNSIIKILGFEQFDLDDPLIGTVMSVRQLNDSDTEFKVGIKFDEGQE